MATTIKLKNGSGAPTAGDLVQGEPALDLTNKRLYTEDSGGTVIEVGVNPSSLTIGGTALTATATELNTLDGITATTTELNYVDGVTSAIQTQIDTKAPTASPTFTGTVTVPGLTTTADVSFGDNDKAIFGAGSDLQIYHDGSNSFISDQGTGNLLLETAGNSVRLVKSPFENMLVANIDGAVQLYYDNAEKLATTSTGIDVTGAVTATSFNGYLEGGVTATPTNASNATIYTASGSHPDYASTDLIIQARSSAARSIYMVTGTTTPVNRLKVDGSGDISFYEDTGTTAKLFWDASAESLGIGTSSPSAKLDVDGGNITAGIKAVEISGSTSFIADGSHGTSLDISHTYSSNDGSFRAINVDITDAGTNNQTLYGLYVNAEANYFSGNLLVGTTDTAHYTTSTTSGHTLFANGVSTHSADGGTVGVFNRQTSDGSIIDFRKDGTSFGSIGVNSGVIPYFARSAGSVGGIALGGGVTKKVYPCDTVGAGADDALDLGDSSTRFKDLYLSGGVYVGGTTSANQLDDYEEGTFDFEFHDADSGGNTSSTTFTGYYTKIGRLVSVTVGPCNNISTAGMTSANFLNFSLPFASSSNNRSVGSAVPSQVDFTTNRLGLNPFVANGVSRGQFQTYQNSGNRDGVRVSALTSGVSDFHSLTITYIT